MQSRESARLILVKDVRYALALTPHPASPLSHLSTSTSSSFFSSGEYSTCLIIHRVIPSRTVFTQPFGHPLRLQVLLFRLPLLDPFNILLQPALWSLLLRSRVPVRMTSQGLLGPPPLAQPSSLHSLLICPQARRTMDPSLLLRYRLNPTPRHGCNHPI